MRGQPTGLFLGRQLALRRLGGTRKRADKTVIFAGSTVHRHSALVPQPATNLPASRPRLRLADRQDGRNERAHQQHRPVSTHTHHIASLSLSECKSGLKLDYEIAFRTGEM